jgi:hypothetical protein
MKKALSRVHIVLPHSQFFSRRQQVQFIGKRPGTQARLELELLNTQLRWKYSIRKMECLAPGPGEVSVSPPGQFGQEIVCNSFGLCASI